MPYGHSKKHPFAPFLGDLDALDWAMERSRTLQENDTPLEELARECEEILARIDPRPEIDSEEVARRLLELGAPNEKDWLAFRRYTIALLTDSPSDHGPS